MGVELGLDLLDARHDGGVVPVEDFADAEEGELEFFAAEEHGDLTREGAIVALSFAEDVVGADAEKFGDRADDLFGAEGILVFDVDQIGEDGTDATHV